MRLATIPAAMASYLDAAVLVTVAVGLPVWRAAFHLGPWRVGALGGGFGLAVATGAILGGWLGDRMGLIRMFVCDLTLFLFGLAVVLLARNGTVLTVGISLVGLGAGADLPVSLAVIAEVVPAHARARVTGLTQLLWIGATILTYSAGLLVSGLGLGGIEILVAHLLVVGILTLALRVLSPTPTTPAASSAGRPRPNLPALQQSGAGHPVAATGVFYLFSNLAATTLGTYGTYFLVRVTGLSQTSATRLVLTTFPIALVMAVLFVRLADSAWRDRIFVVAMILQISGFAVGAVTGGRQLGGMVALIVLYSLSNVFAGEAAYKVWSQVLLPPTARATALGLTYGTARYVASLLAFGVPALLERNPTVALWLLCSCTVVSGAVGLAITRHPRFAAELRAPRVAGR